MMHRSVVCALVVVCSSQSPAPAITVSGSCDGLHLDFGGWMATEPNAVWNKDLDVSLLRKYD